MVDIRKSNPDNVHCAIHPDEPLRCLKCIGAAGGRKTARKYQNKMADWGKKGGKENVRKAKRKDGRFQKKEA